MFHENRVFDGIHLSRANLINANLESRNVNLSNANQCRIEVAFS